MKNLRKSNGITLVALVVTIVVLLILAGVSINVMVGDNGIITKSKAIRSNIEKAEAEGQSKIDSLQQAEYTEDGTVILNDENAPTINSMEVTDVTSTSFTVIVNVTETGSGLAKIEYSIDDGEHYITPNYNQARSYTFEDLNVGFEEYKVKVKVTDVNNNSSTASTIVKSAKTGDYILYDPTKGVSSEKLIYTSPVGTIPKTNEDIITHGNGFGDRTYTANTDIKWRIYDVNKENKVIRLISESGIESDDGNSLVLKAGIGYLYAEEELARICSIYGYGYGANTSLVSTFKYGGPKDERTGKIVGTGARSINMDDIIEKSGYTKQEIIDSTSSDYGKEITFENKLYYPKLNSTKVNKPGQCEDADTENTFIDTNLKASEKINYLGEYEELLSDSDNSEIGRLYYWISERVTVNEGSNLRFCVPEWGYGVLEYTTYPIFGGFATDSYFGYNWQPSSYVRPIVELKPNIDMKWNSEKNAWELL